MPTWQYEAHDDKARIKRGELEAPTREAAAEQLRGEGLFLMSLQDASGPTRKVLPDKNPVTVAKRVVRPEDAEDYDPVVSRPDYHGDAKMDEELAGAELQDAPSQRARDVEARLRRASGRLRELRVLMANRANVNGVGPSTWHVLDERFGEIATRVIAAALAGD